VQRWGLGVRGEWLDGRWEGLVVNRVRRVGSARVSSVESWMD